MPRSLHADEQQNNVHRHDEYQRGVDRAQNSFANTWRLMHLFIQIDDIQGESADARHAGWIEVLDYDLTVRQRISGTASSAGGASAERADFWISVFDTAGVATLSLSE